MSASLTARSNRRRRVAAIGAATVANSTAVLLLQILALIALVPSAFGKFSALYLLFALSSSVLMSSVCEVWQRRKPYADWAAYSATLSWMSLLSALATFVFCSIIPGFGDVAYLASLAVGFSTYRTGSRFHALQQRQLKWVLPGDILSATVLAIGWSVFLVGGATADPLIGIFLLWTASSFASAAASRPASSVRPSAVRWWFSNHKREIRTLLTDSVILDASAIGTPYAILPVLGLSGFGVYRALSNVSSPVKLLLFPLRPMFSSYRISDFVRLRSLAVLFGVATLLGAITYAALHILAVSGATLGTLSALNEYAVPAAIFVAGTLLNGVFYLAGRAHFSRHFLIAGRIGTSLLGIVLPCTGALTLGLQGAIWGVTASVSLGALAWMALTVLESSKTSADVTLTPLVGPE